MLGQGRSLSFGSSCKALKTSMVTLDLLSLGAKPFNVLLTARSTVGLCWMILRSSGVIVSV